MRFGPVPLDAAEGAILAHGLALPDGKLKKGRRLSPDDLRRIAESGQREVTVARLAPEDLSEDTAAARLGAALAPDPAALGLSRSAPFTGRVNLFAERAGLVTVDRAAVDTLNAIDEALTLATLPDATRVAQRQMVATIKVIPYAVPETILERATSALAPGVIAVAPLARRTAGLVLTETAALSGKALAKGAEAVRARLAALGVELVAERTVPHETAAVAAALADLPGELALVLTASATSDREDVGPAGLAAAGGRVTRLGMPVDPGNLLFLGEQPLAGALRPVIGLPGCARSPKLNGADWVLDRIAHGREVDGAAIAAMGVGGLLAEIPSRPAPRTGGQEGPTRPRISALVLAAGAGRRMRGCDKLLEEIEGRALLSRVAAAASESGAEETVVVLAPDAPHRRGALAGLAVRAVVNHRAEEGMGTSIAAGLAAISPDADGVLILLADMPEIGAGDIDRLIAAFAPGEGRAIVRATAEDGTPGHPVLVGRRFFEPLGRLEGDRGAREILAEHGEFLVDLPLPGRAAVTDLDTPEAWDAWRQHAGIAKPQRAG